MCGIAGFCNYKKSNWHSIIELMNKQMIKRGPNGSGSWHDDLENIVLGHCRLSIKDLTQNGMQPMSSNDGRYIMVYNGEIYNYSCLLNKYNIKESSLKSTSDTEVLLEAIAKAGLNDVLGTCRGMFAIALYDRTERCLYLARDRMGEKPLYYGCIKNQFVFASDLKCFEVFPDFLGEINREALGTYMRLSYIPAPDSIYVGIRKLMPGCIAKIPLPFCSERISITEYWNILEAAEQGQNNLFQGNEEEAIDELEKHIREVVRMQMVADVPVGAFLSAGFDSTAIVAMMQSLNTNKIKTFTIGVDDPINEALKAKEIADYIGTEHNELYVTERECLDVIPKLSEIYSEPFADPTQIPTYLVSKLAKTKVSVSLSGDGGDEVFCGYSLYESVFRSWNKLQKIPCNFRRNVGNLIEKGRLPEHIEGLNKYAYFIQASTPYQLGEQYIGEKKVSEYLVKGNHSKPIFYENRKRSEKIGVLNNLMLIDQQLFLPDSHMVKMDRASMSVSLETRAPFLDWLLMEFVWTLPLSFKYRDGVKKKILRELVYRYVPQNLMDMPKRGFSVPLYKWIKRGELFEWAQDLLNIESLQKEGILDVDNVYVIWQSFLDSKNNMGWRTIWNILMFENWFRSRKCTG